MVAVSRGIICCSLSVHLSVSEPFVNVCHMPDASHASDCFSRTPEVSKKPGRIAATAGLVAHSQDQPLQPVLYLADEPRPNTETAVQRYGSVLSSGGTMLFKPPRLRGAGLLFWEGGLLFEHRGGLIEGGGPSSRGSLLL